MKTDIKTYQTVIPTLAGKIVLGCDGFVDETFEMVAERRGPDDYIAMERLKEFGELLVSRAGGGVGLELVAKRRCEGGCAINTGRIAACLGIKPTIFGLFGASAIDPAFEPFVDNCELRSLGDPALTIALEFGDGKVLMSNLAAVSGLTLADVVARIGEAELNAMLSDVDILGLGYWSLTANFDEIFEGLMQRLEGRPAPRKMFFDFADIKKKSSESFLKTLALIQRYNDTVPMLLSLNEHEVLELCTRIGVERPELTPEAMAAALTAARQKIGFAELVVHTPEFAAASTLSEGEAYAVQDRQEKVVRLAGAGDSFNGGYLCASLGDLSLKQRLVVANAATAFFVTQGTGPTKAQLLAQIEKASDI